VRTEAAEDEAADDAYGVVVLDDAVARASPVAVSFAGREYAGVGMLHRSR
jgi:hypothetical protein